jgi:catechol 2,3-dioxygenase-like lactoylglutathione lyase family enzyme
MTRYTWDHIQLRSDDPAAAADWFHRHFGAEIVTGPGRLVIRIGGVEIFVARNDATIRRAPVHPHAGLDHVGLSVDDLDAALAELIGDGVELAVPVATLRPGVRGCYVAGPDGIWIELLERRGV